MVEIGLNVPWYVMIVVGGNSGTQGDIVRNWKRVVNAGSRL